MSSSMPTLVTPSAAHIALALVTIRSKPAHITIEDYLKMLSTSVSQIDLPAEMLHTRLDAAKFWKQAYERAEGEKAQLQDHVHRFESERLALSDDWSESPRKRKASGDHPVKANTQSKRRELDRDPSLAGTAEISFKSVGDNCDSAKSLLREIFHLKCLLRSATPPLDQLSLHIGSFCQAVEATLASTSPLQSRALAKSTPAFRITDLASLFNASYPLVLQSLDHATAHEAPDYELTIANGGIVHLFQAALGHLHKLALDEVTRLEEEQRSKGKKTRSNIKAIKTDLQDATDSLESTSTTVAQMLVSILTSIDPTKDSHCELLEGLLCALLDHIGSSLSLLVFADPEAPDAEIGIQVPCGLADVAHIKTAAALTAAEIEGPYLVLVLKSCLQYLRDNQQRMSQLMQEVFSGIGQKQTEDTDALREKIELSLQGTLLRGVFGDEDKEFDNALRREHPLEEPGIQAIREGVRDPKQDKSTWFIGQIWEQLGWEMLSARAMKMGRDPH